MSLRNVSIEKIFSKNVFPCFPKGAFMLRWSQISASFLGLMTSLAVPAVCSAAAVETVTKQILKYLDSLVKFVSFLALGIFFL